MDWKTPIDKVKARTHWRLALTVFTGFFVGPVALSALFPHLRSVELLWVGCVWGLTAGLLAGTAWQMAGPERRKTTSGRFILIAGGAWMIFSTAGFFLLRMEGTVHARQVELIQALQREIAAPSPEIILSPYELSRKNFRYTVDDPGEIKTFIESARLADTRPVPGHTHRVFECTVEIRTKQGNSRYLACVFHLAPQDLFLSNVFSKRTSERGYTKGMDNRVRLPGLGPWIMKMAPDGVVRQD